MQPDKDNGDERLLGRTIEKEFDGVKHRGVVDKYDKPYYHISYSDGDTEDMTTRQVNKHIVNAPTSTSAGGDANTTTQQPATAAAQSARVEGQ